MTYGGESNGKKFARGTLWNFWGEKWSGGDPGDRDILVFSGPEAADVRAAKAVGADPSRIVVVDTNKNHIESAKTLHPEPRYVHGDVFDLLQKEKKKYDMLFFDFCQTLSDKLLLRVVRVARDRLKRNGLLFIGAMYGRERDAAIRARIEESRVASSKIRKPGVGEDALKADPCAAAVLRWRTVFLYLREMGLLSRMLTTPAMLFSYRSGRLVNGRSCGVPMIYVGVFVRSFRRFQGINRVADVEDQLIAEVHSLTGGGYYGVIRELGDDADGVKLREEVLRLVDKGLSSEYLAQLFNLKRQQIAAWKAWRTMGKGRIRYAS